MAATLVGSEFGWRATHGRLAEALGGYHRSARCELFVPREMRNKDRFGRDCDVRVAQAESYFGVRLAAPVRAYVFRSAGEKRALMGASTTNIAKPWRREVYLQMESWPHSVLAHEVAHVVAGEFGRGPFRISGGFDGLLPNPGLVEGAAVAAAFHPQSGLTPDQWARAMLDLEMVPPLASLLGQGFFGQPARLAYTLSGSFLHFLHRRYGAEALQAVYREGDVARGLNKPLDELEAAWHRYLGQVELSNDGLALAQLRFSGNSIFSAVCPHRIAKLQSQLAQDISAGDDQAALTACEAILETDPSQLGTRTRLIGVLARLGQLEAAKAELKAFANTPGIGSAAVANAKHVLADELYRAGDREAALRTYRGLLQEPLTEDTRRLVQVKTFALEGTRKQAQLLFDFLIGDGTSVTDGAVAVYLLRELRKLRSDGLPHYLEGRQLLFRDRFKEAQALFAKARQLSLPTEALLHEALRVHAISAYASGDRKAAKRLFDELAEVPDPALQYEARDWLSRMAITDALQPPP